MITETSKHHHTKHKHKKFDGKSFIILPILFLCATYGIIYVAAAPTVGSILSAAGMFFSDNKNNYSTAYDDIFVPVADNSTLETKVVEGKTYINDDAVEYPKYNNMFGKLIISDCNIDTGLFFGDGDIALRNGVGVYIGSFIPGYGGTVLIAGHNNTYFNGLKYAEEGQKVDIQTSYGNYVYEITSTAIKESDDPSAYDLSADYENLIMYTCYPFDEIGLTKQRFFVYAKYISGPLINSSSKGE